jgi:hypothetical protein
MEIHRGEIPDLVELEDNFDRVSRHAQSVIPPAHPLVTWKTMEIMFHCKDGKSITPRRLKTGYTFNSILSLKGV